MLVWTSVVFYLWLATSLMRAVILLVWCVLVVSTVDNIIRPLIIGGQTKIPTIFLFFGILGGIGPEPENLLHMKRTADQLFGDQYLWSILGAGRHQMGLVTMGALMANVLLLPALLRCDFERQ